MAIPFNGGRFRSFKNIADGAIEPNSGGKVYSYEAGTTTPKATYNTSVGDVANTNPVILDSEGYADIFLGSGNYKIDVQDSDGVSLPGYPIDDIEGTQLILDQISTTSNTSASISVAEKTFEIEANKAFPDNAWVLISYNSDPSNQYMIGQVTDYTGVNITIDVSQVVGSGTYNDWTLALSGPPGPQGKQGDTGAGTGDMLAAQNLADVADAATSRSNLGLGDAATKDVGTTANKVVQLDANAKIPAVDGSQVTNLNASNISSGTVPTARLGSGTADSTTFLRGDGTWSSLTVPTTAGAVGTYAFAYASVAVANGATTSGSNLSLVALNAALNPFTNVYYTLGSTLSGTWKNLGGGTGASAGQNPKISMWLRTA